MPEAEVENGAKALGAVLRGAREAKGVQVEQASAVTKIGKNYLLAIEEGRFEKLPNPAYLKGFLRLYAGYLGLSADEVIARYEATLPAPRSDQQHEPSTMTVERVRFTGRGRWAIPILLLCLVILTAIFFSEGEKRERPAPPPVLPPPPVARAVAPQPVLPPRSSARALQPAPASPVAAPAAGTAPAPAAAPAAPRPGEAPPAYPIAPGEGKRKGVILKLRFTQDSWLSITIDDAVTQRYDLKAGDVIEWKGAHGFSLDLGDGGAVEGEYNGRALKPFGERGKPAHVELKG